MSDVRAAIRREYGGIETVSVLERPTPDPGRGEVRLLVGAAGVDAGAWVMLAGSPLIARLFFGLRRPRQPGFGWEVSGTVEAVGDGADLEVGDRVVGQGRGSFATHCLAKATSLGRLPDAVGLVEAAPLGISGVTALQAVRDRGEVRSGQRVMVIGAGGGVGTFAVQLARHLGARVTGVCSTGKVELVRGLGAEQVVDYTRDDLASAGPHDVIVDTGGNRSFRELRRCLTPNGRAVVVGSGLEDMGVLGGTERTLMFPLQGLRSGQSIHGLVAKANRADLETLAALVASGEIVPAITARYTLDQVADALRVLGTGHSAGKAVVIP